MEFMSAAAVLRVVRHSLLLYIGAGGIATASHYFVTALLVESANVRPLLGSIVGFGVGAVVKYWLNYSVAFRSTARHATTSARFVVSLALLLGMNALVFAGLNEWLRIHYLVAQIATTIILIGPGYWLSREWVFNRGER